MAKLIYSAIASLDGYVEDAQGDIDWGALPNGVRARLELIDERRSRSGVVHLRYRVRW
jgi:hypothetical protein